MPVRRIPFLAFQKVLPGVSSVTISPAFRSWDAFGYNAFGHSRSGLVQQPVTHGAVLPVYAGALQRSLLYSPSISTVSAISLRIFARRAVLAMSFSSGIGESEPAPGARPELKYSMTRSAPNSANHS